VKTTWRSMPNVTKIIPGAHRKSRRARNSEVVTRTFRGVGLTPFQMEGRMQLKPEKSSTTYDDIERDSLSTVILKSFNNKSLCDAVIVGNDGVRVHVPSYLLAAHSIVFEKWLNESNVKKMAAARETAQTVVGNTNESSSSSTPYLHTMKLPFANMDAIEAAIHFLATRSLPEGLVKNLTETPSEFYIRTVCQIYFIGRLFKIHSLEDEAYRSARVGMNRVPHLVCAAFDECMSLEKKLAGEESCQLPASKNELKEYALEYLRDSPLTTLLAGGTPFLNYDSISAIICDQDMNVDEYTMFHILRSWVVQDEGRNLKAGEELASHIDFAHIKADHLINVVKKCKFVDASCVNAALEEIEEMMANRSPDDKEHVLVDGAGMDDVNGIYARREEDIGLGEDEVAFVKEAGEDEDCPDYTLYLFRSTWAIASSFDPSNVLYSSEARDVVSSSVPHRGWSTIGGEVPAPKCVWKASKEDDAGELDAGGERYVAPNLADNGQHRLSDLSNGDYTDAPKRSLKSMMSLPTDEGYEDRDYHATVEKEEMGTHPLERMRRGTLQLFNYFSFSEGSLDGGS